MLVGDIVRFCVAVLDSLAVLAIRGLRKAYVPKGKKCTRTGRGVCVVLAPSLLPSLWTDYDANLPFPTSIASPKSLLKFRKFKWSTENRRL
jgi:hypothetical protein